MNVSAILARKGSAVATIAPQATISEVVERLTMLGIGALVVSPDGDHLIGIVSERDVVRALGTHNASQSDLVTTIMTTRIFTAAPQTNVDELMALMTEHRVRHVPVTDDAGALVGMISIGDLVKARLDELETERAALMDYITH